MANSITSRIISVILDTDVVGYSTKMEENEVQTINNLKACRNIIDGLILSNLVPPVENNTPLSLSSSSIIKPPYEL